MKKIFLGLLLLLCSCSHISFPTNVYVLDVSSENSKMFSNEIRKGSGPVIAIMPISIPSYLNRPQIVLREKGSKILISENHRWAENLDKAMGRVLATSLTDNLAQINGVAVPLKLGLHPDYTIQLDVSRFEGNINSFLELDAFWTLQKNGKKILQANFYKKIETRDGYSGLVKAYGDLIYFLAEDMVKTFYGSLR